MKEVTRNNQKERNASKGLAKDKNAWKTDIKTYILMMIKFLLNSSFFTENSIF